MLPLCKAQSNAVLPNKSLAFTFAPSLIQVVTPATSPILAASINILSSSWD
jgi:hypothetical protein